MKKLEKLLLCVCILLVAGKIMGQDSSNVSLTKSEYDTFREIAKYWNIGTLIVGLLVAFLLPIAGFIIAKSNFKSWFIPMVGESLMSKKEDLSAALDKLLTDFLLRKNTIILVVSDKIGVNLPMKNFLTEKGFSFSTIGDGFCEINQFNTQNLGGANLVLFNYIGQDLSVVQNLIGDKVLSLNGIAKVVVAGHERMDAEYKKKMGNYLSFCNGYDTLESRIVGAIKQPVA